MRPDEPKSFDPHQPIDLCDAERVSALTDRFAATREELAEAVEKVGSNPVAVAIFLARSDAL